MDLGAYIQIEELESLLTANDIHIPRLRGLRLMREETPLSDEVIQEQLNYELGWAAESMFWNSHLARKYLIFEKDGDLKTFRGVRWDLLHGKRRKNIKLTLKHQAQRVYRNRNTFNQYCGQDNVLYIYARIGGRNWNEYGGPDLERQPWFLCKVDDSFDDTYCDIYTKVDTSSLRKETVADHVSDDRPDQTGVSNCL